MTERVSLELLQKQNAETSNAIMAFLKDSKKFQSLASHEGKLTVDRDAEDDAKLDLGIQHAKDKGVLDKNFKPQPYHVIDVLGKTPTIVANEIIRESKLDEATDGGSVIVLCGLSGTGKGTTVETLRKLLQEKGKEIVTWSNGNVFRSATLLAVTWCEQEQGENIDIQAALSKENLASFMSMLTFGKFDGKYDICINGLGLDNVLVSAVQNTLLKSPKVSKNIPTVAQATQGEVILFAAKAIEIMCSSSNEMVVLLEGREQTVNYVRTPHRFTLTLSDESLIGKRRAAQRLMAAALLDLKASNEQDTTAVAKALEVNLDKMAAEIHH